MKASSSGLMHDTVLRSRAIAAKEDVVWNALANSEVAKSWLGASEVVVPSSEGAFRWEFAYGDRRHVYGESATVCEAEHSMRIVWPLKLIDVDTEVSIVVKDKVGRSEISVEHSGFPHTVLGAVELDCYGHHWDHILEGLASFLEAEQHMAPHRASTGIVPFGASRAVGLVVRDVRPGSGADQVGIGPGDIVRSIDSIVINEMEDFDSWLESKAPGETAQITLLDREVSLTLDVPVTRFA